MLKKLTITFSFLFLTFTACTTKEKYSGNSEQVEPQPVVISGKNAFNLSNGAVQCAYLPKTVTQYTLFCHTYVKSSSSNRSLVASKSMTSLIGDTTESLLLATEFEAGVSLDWNAPQVQSAQNPMSSQSCKVENGGLGYVCDLEFSEAVVSVQSLKMEVVATARDDKGTVATQSTTTDVRDKNAIADEVLVEKNGRSISQYITFEALKIEEIEIKKDETTNVNLGENEEISRTLITKDNYASAGTYCTKRRRTDLSAYSWDVVCVVKILVDDKLVQATGFDASVTVIGGNFQLENGEQNSDESFVCKIDQKYPKMYCSLIFSAHRFVDGKAINGRFSYNSVLNNDKGKNGGGLGSNNGGIFNEVTLSDSHDESLLSFPN